MLTMIDSYPTVYNLGHKAIVDLLKDPVVVQEKIDGSQISFGLLDGVLSMRSKSAKVHEDNPGMFKLAWEAVQARADLLNPGLVYRGEFLSKPKHNVLAYDRVPTGWIIIYDIQQGLADFLSPVKLEPECRKIGFDMVPCIYPSYFASESGPHTMDDFKSLLETTSVLGGQKVEGIVIKNYHRFGRDAKPLFGKYVSEKFKETHAKEWKNQNPPSADILDLLTARFKSEARWQKAVQHLEERGELEGSPRDIGKLFKEVPTDLLKECEEEIKQSLFDWAWKRKLSRSLTAGLAEWYKLKLAERQFAEGKPSTSSVPYCCEVGHPEPAPCPHSEGSEHGGEG